MAVLAESYQTKTAQEWAKFELEKNQKPSEEEMALSQRVKPAELEEVDLGEHGQPRPMMVTKNLQSSSNQNSPKH